ncbi:hypothetical protein QYF36_022812 [Acer negundo]|nr:hypothetical protein QYF36_022812 [Acer negundo]
MDSQSDSYFTNLLNEDSAYDLSNEYENQFEVIQNIDKEPNQSRCSKNFTADEDILLIFAYLNISTDAIQGNEQKSVTYWERVHCYFHEHKKFASVGDNEVGDTFVVLERPMGRKALKEHVRNEKGKRIVDMSAASILKFEEYIEDIKVGIRRGRKKRIDYMLKNNINWPLKKKRI